MKQKKERLFDLTLVGELSLDFINTIDWRTSERPLELINSYEDLLRWAIHTNLINSHDAKHLIDEAKRYPDKSDKELSDFIVFREVLFHIFSSIANKREPISSDIEYLNNELSNAFSHLHLIFKNNGFTWEFTNGTSMFDQLIWKIAQSASELLTSERLKYLRECKGTGCAWLFLDLSRNKSRRWCMMDICGNRAKARRHYEQNKELSSLN